MLIYKHTATGDNLYYVQRAPEPGTQHLDRDTATLVDYVPADWEDYAQPLTETPAGGYLYKRTHAVVSRNPFVYDVYKRLGADPAIMDTLLATVYGFWDGTATVYTRTPISVGGTLNVNIQRLLDTQVNGFVDFMAPAQPTFQILPEVKHGSTGVILRVPMTRKDGDFSGGGLSYDAQGLFIAVRPNNTASTPTYTYSAFDVTIEELTTPGTYQAPSADNARWGFVSPAGMYELHLADAVFAHAGATNLTIMISGGADHTTTVCEVPLPATTVAEMVGNIANVGSPSFAAPTSYTLTTGNQTSGTVANVDSFNNVYHIHTDQAGVLSLTYEWQLEADEQANLILWHGHWNGGNDRLLFELYDCVAAAWVTWFTRLGVNSQVDWVQEVPLVAKYTGTGNDVGKVRVRITGTGLTSCTLRTDQLVVGKTKAPNGIANGSTLILSASAAGRNLQGHNWNLQLGGQSISGIYVCGSSQITGIASGTVPITVERSDFGEATVPPGVFRECGFGLNNGVFTAASVGMYNIDWPKSRVAGGGTPSYDWTAATDVNFRGNLGGGYHTIASGTTISVETLNGGTQTFNGPGTFRFRGNADAINVLNHAADKTSKIVGIVGDININGTGGTVVIKGITGTITDNSDGAVTIESSEAVNLANIGAGAGGLTEAQERLLKDLQALTLI